MTRAWSAAVLLSFCARTACAGMQVTACTGRVEVLARGGAKWAQVRRTPRDIYPGDQLRAGAGSTARLVLEDGAVLEILDGGDFVLQTSNELAQVVELRGGMLSGTLARDSSAGLRILTPAGDIRPSGGEFRVKMQEDGRVLVHAKEGRLTIRSKDGRMSTLSSGDKALFSSTALPVAPARGTAGLASQPAAFSGVMELLEALQKDPDALDIRAKLNTTVTNAYLGHVRRFGAFDAPMTSEQRAEILRRTYSRKAAEVEDEAVQEVFLQGQRAFEEGRYFASAERFLLCRLLRPRDAWVGDALEEYLARQLPERVAAHARSLRAQTARDYSAAFASLLRRDWRAAAEELGRAAASTGTAEFRELSGMLRVRASGMEDAANAQTQTMAVVRAGEADPESAVEAIERMLLRFSAQREAAWWQKAAEGLRRAYVNRVLYRMTLEARARYQEGDFKAATKVLVALLQRSPGHPGAMDLLEKIQSRYEESTAHARRSDEAARRAEDAARAALAKVGARPAPAPRAAAPAVAREEVPDLKGLIQAEAYHQRGLKAYLHGDLPAACEEWRAALRLNPKHEASSRALSRVVKEMGSAKPDGGGT